MSEEFEPVTIAVIGHGKSPEGKNWGPKIDACDYVIRMWNCHWQSPEDYGTKYDYGMIENLPAILTQYVRHNKRQPALGFVVSKLGDYVMGRYFPLQKVIMVSQEPWTALGEELGGLGASGRLQFTRGTVAACWTIESARRGDTVLLVGFDNVHARTALSIEDGFATAWQTDPTNYWSGYREGRKYGNHDFFIELPVMRRLAEKNGVHLKFSQDLWQ